MASLLSNMSACVGLLEFILNPICGKLADSFGRLRFIYASPLINCILKAAVALNPHPFCIGAERIVNGAVTTLAGSTMCSTMLSDLYSGEELGSA